MVARLLSCWRILASPVNNLPLPRQPSESGASPHTNAGVALKPETARDWPCRMDLEWLRMDIFDTDAPAGQCAPADSAPSTQSICTYTVQKHCKAARTPPTSDRRPFRVGNISVAKLKDGKVKSYFLFSHRIFFISFSFSFSVFHTLSSPRTQ